MLGKPALAAAFGLVFAGAFALGFAARSLPVFAADPTTQVGPGQAGSERAEAARKSDDSPHRKMCNQRHYASSALCSDSTCKMREYRKWQGCLKTGNYV